MSDKIKMFGAFLEEKTVKQFILSALQISESMDCSAKKLLHTVFHPDLALKKQLAITSGNPLPEERERRDIEKAMQRLKRSMTFY